MFATPAQFTEIQKGQMDAAIALSQTWFDAAERLMELNLAAAKATLEESVERTQALLSVRDVQELLALSGGMTQPTLEKAVSYSRIANGAGTEVSRIVDAQIAETNKKVAQLIDFAAKNSPAGSETGVSMLKSAVAAANTAYDTFARASRQAVAMAESNVSAATSAALKSASAANDTVKASAKRKAA